MKCYILSFIFIIGVSCAFAQGTSGLVAHWDFNGTDHDDVSGNGLNGINSIGLNYVDGYAGVPITARSFRGVGTPNTHVVDNVYVPYSPLMDVTFFSICALIKPDSFFNDHCQTSSIISRGNEGSPDYYSLLITDNVTDGDCDAFDPASQSFVTGVTNIESQVAITVRAPHSNYVRPGKWSCIVTTYDGVNITTYIDGALYHQLPYHSSPTPSAGYGIRIGASLTSVSEGDWKAQPFFGVIDDIKLYNRALSISEVDMYCDEARAGGLPQWPESVATSGSVKFTVWPNPANDQVHILLQNGIDGKVSLINSMGQIVARQAFNSNITGFNIGSYAPGIYWVRLEANGSTAIKRFIKY